MTFDATAHPRSADGTFAEKVGSPTEVFLNAVTEPDIEKLAERLLRASRRSGAESYVITDDDMALVAELESALRGPHALKLFDAASAFAERLEDANFHSASIAIDAAMGEAAYRADPAQPVRNPTSVMRASADMALVRLAAKQKYERDRDTFAESQSETIAHEWAQERVDGIMVDNPNLDEELVRELHGRVTGWRRNEILAHPNLPADLS